MNSYPIDWERLYLKKSETAQSKLKCNSMNISHGNKLTPGSGSFQR